MSFRDLMHPLHSRIETDILEELNLSGLFPETDKHFCVLSTTPDFYFADKNLAVYVDGEQVHRNRQERDDNLRQLLTKRHGVTVLTFPYKRRSKRVRQKIVEQIKEWMK